MEPSSKSTSKLTSKGQGSHESQPTRAEPRHSKTGAKSSDNSSLVELEKECRMASLMLATLVRGLACDVHERCDGSCGNIFGYRENPVIDFEGLMLSLLIGIVGVNPTSVTTQDVPVMCTG